MFPIIRSKEEVFKFISKYGLTTHHNQANFVSTQDVDRKCSQRPDMESSYTATNNLFCLTRVEQNLKERKKLGDGSGLQSPKKSKER